MTSTEAEEAADAAKTVANEAFKRSDYKDAIKKYGKALRLAAEVPEPQYPGKGQSTRTAQLLANRCMAHLGLGDERAALVDAQQAVRAAPDWPKAHFRHGTVQMRLKNYTKAYAAFKQGHHLDTSNEEMTLACQQAHQQMVGLDVSDRKMNDKELIAARDKKCEEERRERAAIAEGRRAALTAAANGSPAQAYREEALQRTLPLIGSMKQLELSIGEREVILETADGSAYAPLVVKLPTAVDDGASSAKFDKKKDVLTVKMPVAAMEEEGQLV